MARLRSKKGHIATAVISFFFSCFCFFFNFILFFSPNALSTSISRKPPELKFPNLNTFVSAKNRCLKIFFTLYQRALPETKNVKKQMTLMIRRTVSQFETKLYQMVPRVLAMYLFQ